VDRRGFLKGIVIGTSAVGAMAAIKLATPEEALALAVSQPVALLQDSPTLLKFDSCRVTLDFGDGIIIRHEATSITPRNNLAYNLRPGKAKIGLYD